MRAKRVTLRVIRMPMREPFAASHGVEEDKQAIIVEVETVAGASGFAECVAGGFPHYTEETSETAWHILADWLIPTLTGHSFDSVDDIGVWYDNLTHIRGNRMAKAGLEMALWDAFAAETAQPLAHMIGGTKTQIPVGISIGLQATVSDLLRKVERYVEQGFQRVKLKIEPGRDEQWVRAIRREFPDLPLMVDANSAYAHLTTDHLRWLDAYSLLMVEQPLGYDDLIDHAALQKHLSTPICLDESIRSADDVRRAASIGACQVVNVKLGRVGGFTEALRIHDVSLVNGIKLWCGGMLETGIGRLHNIALSALSNFTLPGDTAPSARYFEEDLIDPAVEFSQPGWLPVEALCGVGDRVRRDRVEKWTVRKETFRV